jgi:cytoskeletal protein CcmA (bactofilin family)
MLTSFRKQDDGERKSVGNASTPVQRSVTQGGAAPMASSSLSSQQIPPPTNRPGNTSDSLNMRGADRGQPSVIGSDLVITGNLTSKGQMQIDGEVQGDINGSHVIVGERARITGGIRSEEVVVRGKVQGSIHSNRVMLQANSHVEGDIFHKALAIEQGAFFEGKSRRSDNPLEESQSNGGPAAPVPISVPARS